MKRSERRGFLKRLFSILLCVVMLGTLFPVSAFAGDGGEQKPTPPRGASVTVSLEVYPPEGGTVSGGGTYSQGSSVTVSATPKSGYVFVCWIDYDSQEAYYDNPYTFTAASNVTLEACFKPAGEHFLSSPDFATSPGQHERGTIDASPHKDSYKTGDILTLSNSPKPGYEFVRYEWAATASGSTDEPVYAPIQGNTFTFPDSDVYIRGVFRCTVPHTITVVCSEGGTYSISPDGPYYEGDTVTLTAIPNDGYRLAGASGLPAGTVCSGKVYTIPMSDKDETITLQFEELPNGSLTLKAFPEEGGTLTWSQDPATAEITVTATPNDGYFFVAWVDGDDPSTVLSRSSTYVFTTTENIKLSGFFQRYAALPEDGGTVSVQRNEATGEVTLSAAEASGYVFEGWYRISALSQGTGAAASKDAVWTFLPEVLTKTDALAAVFQPYVALPAAGGTVSAQWNAATGEITFSAAAASGYAFEGWHWYNELSQGNNTPISTDAVWTILPTPTTDIDTLVAIFLSTAGHRIYVASNIQHGSVTVSPEKSSYTQGETITLSAVPDEGWTLDQFGVADVIDGSVQAVVPLDGDSFIMPDNDVAVTAVFARLYTVAVTADPAAGGTVSGGGSYKDGASVTVTATANGGYVFEGWMENGSVVSTDASYTFTVTGDRELTANFAFVPPVLQSVSIDAPDVMVKGQSYQIVITCTFDRNYADNDADCLYVHENTSCTTPYGFYEYYRGNADFADNGNVYTISFSMDVPSDTADTEAEIIVTYYGAVVDGLSKTVTLTAPNDCVVSFEANGGSGTMEPQSVQYGVATQLNANAFTRAGYEFTGWNTKADGTGTPYDDRQSVTLTESVTLYAQWTGKPYTIEYWSDAAGSQKHVQTAYYDRTGRLDVYSDRAFGWDSGGKTLHGWTVESSGAFLDDGGEFLNLCGAPDANGNVADAVIIAVWEENSYTVTVSASPKAGGTVTGGGDYAQGASVTVTAAAAYGYTFAGWMEGDTVVSTDESYTFTVTGNRTLTASFENTLAIPGISVTATNTYVGGCTTIVIHYPADATRPITIKLDDAELATSYGENGVLVYYQWLYVIATGTHTVQAIYNGDEQYAFDAAETTFTVTERDALINSIPAADGGYVYMDGIKWRVVGMGNMGWLLTSAEVLGGNRTWESAKDYCAEVYEGFSAGEQNAVRRTNRSEGEYTSTNGITFAGTTLSDATLFLLSASEAETYFSSNADRQPGWWWLRSPISHSDYDAGAVDGDGDMVDYYANYDFYFGARPAFQLDTEVVLFTSAAEGGKASEGALAPFDDGSGGERKLTLRDDGGIVSVGNGHENFHAEMVGTDGDPLKWKFKYSGATVGDNEYISAVIYASTDGVHSGILYYGRLCKAQPDPTDPGAEPNTVTVDLTALPSELLDFYYNHRCAALVVFNEQYNGDKMTDYASDFQWLQYPTYMTLELEDLSAEGDALIVAYLPDNATGILTLTVDGRSYDEYVVDGRVDVTVSGLAAGTYVAQAVYEGDDCYMGCSAEISFTVTGPAAEVGGVQYNTLPAAIDAAQAGDTVTLLRDIAGDDFQIDKDLTLDLNGHTISAAESAILAVNGGTVTIRNGKVESGGINGPALLVNGGEVLIADGAEFANTVGEYAVFVWEGKLSITGGKIKGKLAEAYGATLEIRLPDSGAAPIFSASADDIRAFCVDCVPAANTDSATAADYPTTVVSSTVTEYPIWVGGVQVTSANQSDILNDGGSASFAVVNGENVLTLNNADVTGYYHYIANDGISVEEWTASICAGQQGYSLTVVLLGENKLGGADYGLACTDWTGGQPFGTLTLTGSGTLTASGRYGGVSVFGALAIEGTKVTALAAGSNAKGIFADGITVTDSSVRAEGTVSGLYCAYPGSCLSVMDSTVSAKGAQAFGIDFVILTIGGTSVVTAETETGSSGAVRGFDSIELNDGVVLLTPDDGKIENDGYGYKVFNADGSFADYVVFAHPCTVTLIASPSEGGTLTGGGGYAPGASVTVTATANDGYLFHNWTENGSEVSCEESYTFTADGDRTLTANFLIIPEISVTATDARIGEETHITVNYPADADPDGLEHSCAGLVYILIDGINYGAFNGVNGVLEYDFLIDDSFSLGTHTVRAQFNGEGHYAAAIAETTITVLPAEYTITVVGGTADKTEAKAGDTVTITANDAEYGYAFVQWAQLEGVDFAQGDGFTTTFTMPAKDVTITAVFREITLPTISDQTYTGEEIKPTFGLLGVTLDGVDGVYSGKYILTYEDNIDVGTATVTLTFKDPATGEPDARLGTKSTTFQIVPADISTATVTVADQTYNSAPLTPEPTVTWNGKTLEKDTDYTLSYSNNVYVGQATVTVTGKGNFDENTSATGNFTINKAPLTITAEDKTKVYDGDAATDPALTATVIGKPASGAEPVYSLSREAGQDAKDYAITVTADAESNPNYTITVENGTFTITPASVTLTANSGAEIYDGTVKTVTGFTSSVAGLSFTGVSASGNGTDAGNYPVTFFGVTIGTTRDTTGNYVVTGTTDGTLTIDPAAVTITVDNKTKVRGEDDPAFTGTVEGLIADGDLGVIRYFRTNSGVEEAGTYPGVIDAAYTANPNYTVTVQKGDFTIRELYTVIWKNGDGSELYRATYAEGDPVPTYTGETPTKPATAQYSYVFARWDDGTVDGTTTTYEPIFTATVNKYTVRFVNEDGTELQSGEVAYGETPAYTGETPTKAATAQYTYSFAGWTPELVPVTEAATYTATYSSTVNKYTVRFVNEDGTELQSGEVAYGETPAYTGETPTKAATAQYTYSFADWTPELVPVTEAATYTAAYTATVNKYTVSFETSGGSAVAAQTLKYGEKPMKPADPTKEGNAFDGWYADAALTTPFDFSAPIEGDTVVYAKWTPNDYRIKSVTGATADASHSWTKGSGVNVILTVALDVTPDNSFAHYVRTEIDGSTFSASAREGSTIVTLKAADLQKLSVGVHTVTIVFDNGSVDVRLTVKADPRSPATGDDRTTGLWAALTIFAMMGMGGSTLVGKKRRTAGEH